MATCIICEEPAYITGAGGFATCRPHYDELREWLWAVAEAAEPEAGDGYTLRCSCVIDGRRRDRYDDPTAELDAMAVRWSTEQTRQLVDTATELGTEWANTARIISEEK